MLEVPAAARLSGMHLLPTIGRSASAVLLASAVLAAPALAQAPAYPDPAQRVLTHREQAPLVKGWIEKRFDTVLPELMTRDRHRHVDHRLARVQRRPGVPLDGAAHDLLVAPAHDPGVLQPGGGKPVERYSVGRFDMEKLFTLVATPNDGQWEGLRKLVEEKNPKVIGINESEPGITPTA